MGLRTELAQELNGNGMGDEQEWNRNGRPIERPVNRRFYLTHTVHAHVNTI